MALKSFRDRRPIVVGIVSLLVLGLTVFLVFITGTMGLLKNRYEMSGVFTDTGGLRTGNDVLIAGVRVGQITAVDPDHKAGHVIVKWKVDRGIDLGPQTRAEIRMANILGGRYLRLTGPVTKPYMEDLSAAKRRIPTERTDTPILVTDVLKEGTETLQGLDSETFGKVLDQLSGLSKPTRIKLENAFRNLTEIAEGVNESDGKIEELLDNSDRVLKVVQEKDKQLSRLVNNAMTLIETLKQRRTQLTMLLGSGSGAVQSINKLITTQQTELLNIIDDLNSTMNKLDPTTDELNTTLAWAGPSLAGFASIADQGNFVDVIFAQIGQLAPQDLAKLVSALKKGGK